MPVENLASKKIKKMKVGYVSKPENIEDFLNNCRSIMINKKLRTRLSKNSINYLKTKQTSINRMIRIIKELS